MLPPELMVRPGNTLLVVVTDRERGEVNNRPTGLDSSLIIFFTVSPFLSKSICANKLMSINTQYTIARYPRTPLEMGRWWFDTTTMVVTSPRIPTRATIRIVVTKPSNQGAKKISKKTKPTKRDIKIHSIRLRMLRGLDAIKV